MVQTNLYQIFGYQKSRRSQLNVAVDFTARRAIVCLDHCHTHTNTLCFKGFFVSFGFKLINTYCIHVYVHAHTHTGQWFHMVTPICMHTNPNTPCMVYIFYISYYMILYVFCLFAHGSMNVTSTRW